MRLAGVADKFYAIFRRDLLTALRYPGASWMLVVSMLAELASFYYLSRAIGPRFRPDGMDYFPFLLVGTSFYSYLLAAASGLVSNIREAQTTGTIEVLMTSSTSAPWVVILSAFSVFLERTLYFALYLAAGFTLVQLPAEGINLLGCAAVFLLSLVLSVALGIGAAALQITLQRGGSAVWLFGLASSLLTGTMFPISALPAPIQKVSAMIPFTYSINGLRRALLTGGSLTELAPSLLVLSGFALLLLPASILLLSRALRHARYAGTLSFY